MTSPLPMFTRSVESFFFNVEGLTDSLTKKHMRELSELAYTYLVECTTKSFNELKADEKFAYDSKEALYAQYPSSLNDDFMGKRNALIRVYNRHEIIGCIANRLIAVETRHPEHKLSSLRYYLDTPVFSLALEYAENRPRYFPNFGATAITYSQLMKYIELRFVTGQKRKG